MPYPILQDIPIDKINILNPRERNRTIANEIKKNIEDVGLKRPITVSRRLSFENGKEYDLVCGQGRLEAYVANEEKFIPAIVVDINEEEALIKSLVENIARKNYSPTELLQSIKHLKEIGYSIAEISKKTGLSPCYIEQISKLLLRGEERLINAVHSKRIPINVAIDISDADDKDVQFVLSQAYEQGKIRGSKLQFMRELIERRHKKGKAIYKKKFSPKQLTAQDIQHMLEQEIARKQLTIKKNEKVKTSLIFIVQSLKKLLKDGNFVQRILLLH